MGYVLLFRARHPRGKGAGVAEAHALYLVAYGLGDAPATKARAEALYRRAIALDPEHAPAWHNLGTLLDGRGLLLDAIACYRRAMALEPAQLETRWALGKALCSRALVPLGFDGVRRAAGLPASFPGLLANAVLLAEAYAHLRLAERLGGAYGDAAREAADQAPGPCAKLDALARPRSAPPAGRRPGKRRRR